MKIANPIKKIGGVATAFNGSQAKMENKSPSLRTEKQEALIKQLLQSSRIDALTKQRVQKLLKTTVSKRDASVIIDFLTNYIKFKRNFVRKYKKNYVVIDGYRIRKKIKGKEVDTVMTAKMWKDCPTAAYERYILK